MHEPYRSILSFDSLSVPFASARVFQTVAFCHLSV